MRPTDVGLLFDQCAAAGVRTTVHLDRPFDLAPDRGVDYDVPRLAGLVAETAGWLAVAGAGPGDRVAIVKDNHWDCALLACAAARIGALPALISGGLPAETLRVLLTRLGPAVLVTCDRVVRAIGTGLAVRTLNLDHQRPDGERPGPAHRRRAGEPLVITHTSGTTGVPKLVVHSTKTLVNRLARFESVRWPVLGTRPGDTVVNAASFVHGRTFCWTASVFCLAPRKIGIVTDFDPRRAEPFLHAHPPTTVEATPAVYVRWQRLTDGPASPFRDVRLYVSTYDAMHPPAVRAFLGASARRFPLWLQGWGQTETGPLTFRFLTRRALARTGERHPTTRDLGRPVPGRTDVRVVDPDTLVPVPRGRSGVLMVRTKARCLDYVGEEDRYAAKSRDGWWNTGDVGTLDRTGRVRLLDREVDMVPGLSCVELEDVLEDRLPGVVECVVLGSVGRPPLPVLVTSGGTLDRRAWQAAVADLPPLADPVVMAWDEIPRTATGKVRRLALHDRLLGGADLHGTGRWT
jgi:acyl-coenzyme A synthetase/AMP-(fatty) acid ligase